MSKQNKLSKSEQASLYTQLGSDILNSALSAQAFSQQGRLNADLAKMNARLRNIKKLDIQLEARRRVTSVKRKSSNAKSAMMLEAAAQGIDITSGNINDLFDETEYLSELDVENIKSDAVRQAFNVDAGTFSMKAQSDFQRETSKARAKQSIVGGGLDALNTYQKFELNRLRRDVDLEKKNTQKNASTSKGG